MAGLTDGLLVHSPTDARVDTYLQDAAVGDVRVGPIPLAMTPPSAWDLAACAVMAGCRPALLPARAGGPRGAHRRGIQPLGVQTTTSGVAPLLVVSGSIPDQSQPIPDQSQQIDTLPIGRAVRLALHALGNALPGVTNLSTQGHPGKLSWCIAESPDSPWAPLHSDRLVGVDRAVTAVAAVGTVEAVLGQIGPEVDVDLLARACAAVRDAGLPQGVVRRQAFVLIPPEVAHRLDTAGWDRHRLSSDLLRRAGAPTRPTRAPSGPSGPTSTGPLGVAGRGRPARGRPRGRERRHRHQGHRRPDLGQRERRQRASA